MTTLNVRTTPLRDESHDRRDGLHFLGDAGLTYHDGGEGTVLELLRSANDLSSMSDELVTKADSWSVRYHFDPTRANIVRPLQLNATDVVLEIGAGCGAITRYLGEVCGTVDAVEPMADRAACARERTRDLDNVEVFVGLLEDVPLQPTYDAVFVIGVLEYVGRGSADAALYSSFLARAAQLLVPGGTLVLSIENRLGVKYFAGAPEDHSGRFFENIQGYDQQSIARTFSRKELEEFMAAAGLTTTTFGAFPDYKLTRCVISDELFAERPELATTVPQFPSPDWNGGGYRVANEARIWQNLVRAGMGPQTANSLLLLGHRGEGASSLWPDTTLLTFFSGPGLRPVYSIETTVRRSDEHGLELRRRPLVSGAPADGMAIETATEELLDGRDLLQLIVETSSDVALRELLLAWRDALDQYVADGAAAQLDLIPHNAVQLKDDTIHFVDSKWNLPGYDRDAVIERAALVLATQLATRTSSLRWSVTTVRELALQLGGIFGLAEDGAWLEEALMRESHFHALLNTPAPTDANLVAQALRIRGEFDNIMKRSLRSFGGYAPADMEADLSAVIAQAREAAESLQASRIFRYSRLPRHLYYRLKAKISH